jgi:hypothetical protein
MMTTHDVPTLHNHQGRMDDAYQTMLALVNDATHDYYRMTREWHTRPRLQVLYTVGLVSALERIARSQVMGAHYRSMELVQAHDVSTYADISGARRQRADMLSMYAKIDYMLGRLHYAATTEPENRETPVYLVVCHCALCPVTEVSPNEHTF